MRILAALVVLLGCFSSPAESFSLEGTAFNPGKTPIVWDAKIERTNLWIYRIIPQIFSPAIVSNAMSIGSFRGLDKVGSRDTNWLRFQKPKPKSNRHLEIQPSSGWIKYWDDTGTSDMVGPVVNVPEFQEVERLGLELLFQLGIDRTQIATSPRLKNDVKRSKVTPAGQETNTEVQARGMMFTRSVDGIHFLGLGSRGGLSVQFGNNARIIGFELVWPNLIPYELGKTATPDQMLAFIKNGEAVYSSEVNFLSARKFRVKSLTPCYWGPFETEPQAFAYPLASMQIEAEFETNKVEFELVCPILSHLP